MVGKVCVTRNTSRNKNAVQWRRLLRKSKRSQATFTFNVLGKDISALDALIRVPQKIGSRTTLSGNDMYLCGLYDKTIYQWMNHVGVCEDYAFLLSYGQYGDRL